MRDWGTGSGASRLISGSLKPHHELEETIAKFKGCEAALTFSSGYSAALAAVCTLAGRDDVVIMDKLSHACLVDGARLSGATIRVFPHNHLAKLEHLLKWARDKLSSKGQILVITESVFGMDGDTAPLKEIIELVNAAGAMLLVDEAHGTGTIGPQGKGLAAELGVVDQITVHLGTLSKALGSSGGFVAGSRQLIELLINRARPFIYSTAPAPAVAAAANAAIGLLLTAEGERLLQRLREHIDSVRQSLACNPENSPTPIIPVIVGDETAAVEAAQILRAKGIYLPAIRYPTVAKGSARLRISLSAAHQHDMLEFLINIIRTVIIEKRVKI